MKGFLRAVNEDELLQVSPSFARLRGSLDDTDCLDRPFDSVSLGDPE